MFVIFSVFNFAFLVRFSMEDRGNSVFYSLCFEILILLNVSCLNSLLFKLTSAE